MQLADLLAWIEGTAAARFLAEDPLVYPLVSALHLLGIGLLFGSIVPVDLRLLRLVGPQFDSALPSLIRLTLIGFTLAVASGLLLASVRIVDYAQNPAFLAKMAILLIVGINALLLRRLSGPREMVQMVGTRAGRVAATTSLVLWISAVVAGRWIAFI
jgi:hypothetical protein